MTTNSFSPFTPQIMTWECDRERLESLGLPTEEIERIRRATSGKRFEERKRAVEQATYHFLSSRGVAQDMFWAWGALLLAVEVNGVGGRGQAGVGLEGGGWCSTDRHIAFCGLGKGRRHASDGGVWDAALSSVRGQYWRVKLNPALDGSSFYVEEEGDFKEGERELIQSVTLSVEEVCRVLGREWIGAFLRAQLAKSTVRSDKFNQELWAQLLVHWTKVPPDPEPPKEEEEPPNGEL